MLKPINLSSEGQWPEVFFVRQPQVFRTPSHRVVQDLIVCSTNASKLFWRFLLGHGRLELGFLCFNEEPNTRRCKSVCEGAISAKSRAFKARNPDAIVFELLSQTICQRSDKGHGASKGARSRYSRGCSRRCAHEEDAPPLHLRHIMRKQATQGSSCPHVLGKHPVQLLNTLAKKWAGVRVSVRADHQHADIQVLFFDFLIQRSGSFRWV
mmetsp:Transcript_22251/g.51489  ORF Transcript_22251/g.51489 Transcript_22251/m.51489 type:complete len:210 (+) Transcript_22251:1063-1692(+)